MELELINPYVMKILISTREKDSISSISKRINLSYGWTYKWISVLIKEGIFKEQWRGFSVNKNNEGYKKIINFLKRNFSKNINFYYEVLSLFGIKYSFTKTDAVYIWTEGGYNIARYKNYYPIFIKIKESDYKIFSFYCKKLGLKINSKRGVFYSPKIVKDFNCTIKENNPIDSLKETIQFMQKYEYNFQPALEMINEMYKKKLKIKYKEVITNA